MEHGVLASRSIEGRLADNENEAAELEEARAAEASRRCRVGNKAYFDSHKRMRPLHQKIGVRDLVLMQNTRIQKSWDKKLDSNWTVSCAGEE